MSEIVMFVAAVTGAGWLLLGAVALLALGFLAFDRQPKAKPEGRDVIQPGARRAA